ncbi:alkaline shock response membrane anchor protein AmaP [Secundilactobacillus folii]|uniref:Alkaline shock response membrane anchor protein AmaP n=1 Tax=Secundilactobacillus folii TaxID=2678357 RepID=A0A7X2XTU2_9LACO|nr:alkaline shock response membrane anchor protein AmaP [Secundilactobacillus folii]MTV81425.1 alkaline shock response membrane anchor protein AmaP [Secundilactobacillus folii]
MNKSEKVLLLLVGLLAIVQSVWLIAVIIPLGQVSTWLLTTIQTKQTAVETSAIVISGLLTFIGLLAIFIALMAPGKVDRLIFRFRNGQLSISKKAVENTLRAAILNQEDVTAVSVKVKMTARSQHVRVTIKAVNRDDNDLVEKGKRIQELVVAETKRILAVPVKRVKLRLKPYQTLNQKMPRQSRVV